MKNPWEDFSKQAGYILPNDKEIIEKYDEKVKKFGDVYKIRDEQLPGPYLGNPKEALVVILSLNPGYNKDDTRLHKEEEFKECLKKNLLHKEDIYPFYYLSPFCKEIQCGGYKYWYPRLKDIINEISRAKSRSEEEALRQVAQKVSVIEWLPYHSEHFYYLKDLEKLESHKYSVELAKEALENPQKLIIVQRAYNLWKISLGLSSPPKNLITKRGKQCRTWYLTKYNLGEGKFNLICDRLMAS